MLSYPIGTTEFPTGSGPVTLPQTSTRDCRFSQIFSLTPSIEQDNELSSDKCHINEAPHGIPGVLGRLSVQGTWRRDEVQMPSLDFPWRWRGWQGGSPGCTLKL